MSAPIKTRFAPSPTGPLHWGNLRTALFSWLLARSRQGRFLLRIEDSDADRSSRDWAAALMRDLRWLGLEWDEGPQAGGEAGPYWQSQRAPLYAQDYATLLAQDRAYPCFCSEARLAMLRRTQRAAGQPPRYDGACARLAPSRARARVAAGEAHTLRLRLPSQGEVTFFDQVRGLQRFAWENLGDFIIRRADGSAAFLFCNAVDDARMGVTDVLRGEDHLSNTPRQLAVLEALGLPAPRYGHLSTLLGADGAKLSKRTGAPGAQSLREQGWLPLAVLNTLVRLGHHDPQDDGRLLSLAQWVQRFDVSRLSGAPAHFDEAQLRHYQKQALAALSDAEFAAWLDATPATAQKWREPLPAGRELDFVRCVRANLGAASQAGDWARRLFCPQEAPASAAAAAALRAAGAAGLQTAAAFFAAADSFPEALARYQAATGLRGKALYLPLRVAWTGETQGPELACVYRLLGAAECARRLSAAAAWVQAASHGLEPER